VAKPIVFYGTSITQGACASRPGMAYVALLERRLGRPTINLGFSGSGRMEAEVAELLTELDPAAYVIDCLWNMGRLGGKTIETRVEGLVRTLRRAHPHTPILLVGQSHFAGPHPTAASRAQQAVFQRLVDAGIPNIHLLPGDDLLGEDTEGTVDGCHPNDLGMMRLADALAPVIAKLLPEAPKEHE
jgi:lysophospholipase L1-like esterase